MENHKLTISRLILLLSITVLMSACSTNKFSPADLVNPLQGSNSERQFSTGNTYPAVARPWGNNFWTPQSRKNGDGWQYVYTDLKLVGFKQTHQPSPWINDYGCWSLMPQKGKAETDCNKRALTYTRENEHSTPYLYEVLFDNGIQTAMTATANGAAFRINFCASQCKTNQSKDNTIQDKNSLIIDAFSAEGSINYDKENNRITGHSAYYAQNNNAHLPENFSTYFIVEPDETIEDVTIVRHGNKLTAIISFGQAKEVNLKAASSFISPAQALTNFNRELKGASFEELIEEARNEWNQHLSAIEVTSTNIEQLRTFYTAMYRAMLFPRKTHEYSDNGEMLHYSFFTGETLAGPMYADNGFWDTFRAVHPLFTIIKPSLSEEFMHALLNIYKEGGWLPEWFSPGYKKCMIGQHSSSVIADAFLKGLDIADPKIMSAALLKGAEFNGPNATGRAGIEAYRDYGYIPTDINASASVSRTLEYAYNDWCIYRFAEKAGLSAEIINLYKERSMNYANVFDQETGFMRPKSRTGEWAENFSPDEWSEDFTEGSSWHWTWSVFHDPAGLIKLMGGDEAFVRNLDAVFTAEPTIGLGQRKKMIHEMEEMIACNMGQYAHGNQPIQHMPYLYNYAGAAYKTQQRIHEITTQLYHSGINDGKGLCGDEDNGQTSSWYIFSALGFYPICPGSGEYIIGTPMFEKASINLENGKHFHITAEGVSPENYYIQSATLNGEEFNRSFITHEEIMAGGKLHFVMGPKPCTSWASDSRPYSLSTADVN